MTVTRFNIISEAKKVLSGKRIKLDEQSLLLLFADLVLRHNGVETPSDLGDHSKVRKTR
jgi:hypothetical protein